MNHFHIPKEAYKIGLLDPDYHARLILDIDRHSRNAGIPPKFVVSRLSKYCTINEIQWVRRMNLGNDNGMLYIGEQTTIAIEDKMSAIAGACLRNYISAQVMSVQEVLALLKGDDMVTPTVLLIPNFYIGKSSGGSLPAWQISSLLGLLYSRLAKNLHTIVYVQSKEGLIADYGNPFWQHFQSHYFIVEGNDG